MIRLKSGCDFKKVVAVSLTSVAPCPGSGELLVTSVQREEPAMRCRVLWCAVSVNLVLRTREMEHSVRWLCGEIAFLYPCPVRRGQYRYATDMHFPSHTMVDMSWVATKELETELALNFLREQVVIWNYVYTCTVCPRGSMSR